MFGFLIFYFLLIQWFSKSRLLRRNGDMCCIDWIAVNLWNKVKQNKRDI